MCNQIKEHPVVERKVNVRHLNRTYIIIIYRYQPVVIELLVTVSSRDGDGDGGEKRRGDGDNVAFRVVAAVG